MIKSITVTNPLGEQLKLELMRPEQSGFIVKSIDGLGPTTATINMTDVATIPGSLYNSSRQTRRDIVMNLEFVDDPAKGISIEDRRHESYHYFPSQEKVHLLIETDRRTMETTGYVQANEPDIFSKNEGCAITINCEDAYLYAIKDVETMFSGVISEFSFPFSNDSLKESLISMGTIIVKSEELIRYEGYPEIGMIITMHAVGEADNVTVHNVTTRKQMYIDTVKLAAILKSEKGIMAGDTIVIDTRDRYRTITHIRDGIETNILNCLKRGTDWLTLKRGDNIIAYEADNGSSNLQFRITNKVAYLGV